jgi:predicted phage tail protein
MHTRAEARNGSVQAAVHEVAEHARNLARLEVELAASELKQKTAALGAGAVAVALGGVLILFAFGYLTAAAAAGLATFLPTWSALLIVGGVLLVLAGLLLMAGKSKIRSGVPPVPEQAVEEAKLTGAVLKGRNSG